MKHIRSWFRADPIVERLHPSTGYASARLHTIGAELAGELAFLGIVI
jgi:hypothetical protein